MSKYSCATCNYNTNNVSEFKRHNETQKHVTKKKTLSSNKPYKCDDCDARYLRIINLDKHKKTCTKKIASVDLIVKDKDKENVKQNITENITDNITNNIINELKIEISEKDNIIKKQFKELSDLNAILNSKIQEPAVIEETWISFIDNTKLRQNPMFNYTKQLLIKKNFIKHDDKNIGPPQLNNLYSNINIINNVFPSF